MRRTLLALAATALILSGCSAGASDQTGAADGSTTIDGSTAVVGAPEPAPAGAMVAEGAVGDTAKAAVPTQQQVIRTANVMLEVDDVTASSAKVHALVLQRNGQITYEDAQVNGESRYANITAQVPADALDGFIADVSKLGNVTSVNISAQDVTTQVVDLDARIKALQTGIDRLTTLMASATRLEDMLAIETQLSQRQAELDSLKAQREWLGTQVAMSSVTVSLTPKTQIASADSPGFWSGLQSGWSAFLALIAGAVTAVGFLLPFLVVAAIIVAVVLWLSIGRSRRRARQGTSEKDTSEKDTESTAANDGRTDQP